MAWGNYYISSFIWSTAAKILTAIVGFVTVPLLLGYYGKAEYGLLSIATACNGYMSLLDLGMNTGAVKFFSQWKAEGDMPKVFRVARTNITFYIIISAINVALLLLIAFFGENLFAVEHDQFLTIRRCLFVICLFSLFSWVTTVFNQLLIADGQMAYTMKVQCLQALLKGAAVALVFIASLDLTEYFFMVTAIVAMALLPYASRCKRGGLIDSLWPAWHWDDFKAVITFSLSIFALSLFQMTATQSRPILLGMFASDGATAVADFRIIEVVPQLIIMIGGTFSGIFLPKTSQMVAENDTKAMHEFAYKWTTYTSAITAMLCFPFILCAGDALSAYVGKGYAHLAIWLQIWCVTVLVQMHTTPGNALVLAYGKTKLLVRVTAAGCICSMALNIALCKYFEVGSAIIAYFIYVLFIIGLYYAYFYKKLLQLDRLRMLKCFAIPMAEALVAYALASLVPVSADTFGHINGRIAHILACATKTLLWIVPYAMLLKYTKTVNFTSIVKKRKNETDMP